MADPLTYGLSASPGTYTFGGMRPTSGWGVRMPTTPSSLNSNYLNFGGAQLPATQNYINSPTFSIDSPITPQFSDAGFGLSYDPSYLKYLEIANNSRYLDLSEKNMNWNQGLGLAGATLQGLGALWGIYSGWQGLKASKDYMKTTDANNKFQLGMARQNYEDNFATRETSRGLIDGLTYSNALDNANLRLQDKLGTNPYKDYLSKPDTTSTAVVDSSGNVVKTGTNGRLITEY